MRLGLLTDIHEHVENLSWAVEILGKQEIDEWLVLGDIFDNGVRISETISILGQLKHRRLYGNHDLGLCLDPEPATKLKYSQPVMDFFGDCLPLIEIGEYRFTHGMPNWDPTDPTIYYIGDPVGEPAARAAAFGSLVSRVFLMGHFHQWALYIQNSQLDWNGDRSIQLELDQRYLVVLGAVFDGCCATLDTETGWLTPFRQ